MAQAPKLKNSEKFKINRTCKLCGTTFQIERWRLKDPTRGKYCSPTCSFKRTGPLAANWQGGITERSQNMHWTYKYRKVRQEVLFEQPDCRFCGSTYKLCVDHIIPLAVAPSLAHSKSNLQVLCRSCHLDKTRYDISLVAAYKREGLLDV